MKIALALTGLLFVGSAALAAPNPNASSQVLRVPQGRGSYTLVQMPMPAAVEAPYALLGNDAANRPSAVRIPQGRGQSITVWQR